MGKSLPAWFTSGAFSTSFRRLKEGGWLWQASRCFSLHLLLLR
jgi:hypothetical protein